MTSFLDTFKEKMDTSHELAIFGLIARLPADEVPDMLLAVEARKKLLATIQKMLETRAEHDGLKEFTRDGQTYDFRAPRKRVVSASRQLKKALYEASTKNNYAWIVEHTYSGEAFPHHAALEASFRENEPTVLLTELDIFLALDPVYAEAAADYITWSEDANPHLRPKLKK